MMRSLLPALILLACVAFWAPPRAAADDGAGASGVPPAEHVEAPDLFRAKLAQVDAILGHRGLKRGVVYEISRERMYAYLLAHASHVEDPGDYVKRFGRGRVFSQNPRGGKAVPRGSKIDIVLIARNDGKVPPHPHFKDLEVLALPGEARAKETKPAVPGAPLPLREPPQTPPTPESDPPQAPAAAPAAPSEAAPQPDVAPAQPEKPASESAPGEATLEPTAARPDRVGPTPATDAPVATGSPEAPREAGPVDPNVVPRLVGLDLVDAETLARLAGLEIYVERVAGHPVGRILSQVPASGTPKPQGNVIKVTVTAGGDYAAATPVAPDVYVTYVHVPDLLDRTKLQAKRILEDIGLEVTEEVAKRGMPGRVVDQEPTMGAKVRKGSIVVIRVGPGALPSAPTGPYRASGAAPDTPRELPEAPVAGKAGAPRPISPTASTRLPTDATIPMGFSWSKVKAATAYLLEVEEQTATGSWLANTRKPVRRTAVTLELERFDTRAPRAFRWRVRAVLADGQGPASDWVELR